MRLANNALTRQHLLHHCNRPSQWFMTPASCQAVHSGVSSSAYRVYMTRTHLHCFFSLCLSIMSCICQYVEILQTSVCIASSESRTASAHMQSAHIGCIYAAKNELHSTECTSVTKCYWVHVFVTEFTYVTKRYAVHLFVTLVHLRNKKLRSVTCTWILSTDALI